MVRQVPTLAILMMVNGAFNCVAGLGLAVGVPMLISAGAFDDKGIPPSRDETVLLSVIMVVIGMLAVASGLLHIVAGMYVRVFRARTLALVALFSNIGFFLVGGLCATLGIALMVYGLVVVFNRDVVKAFERVARGGSADIGGDADGGYDRDDELDEWERRPRRRDRDHDRYDNE